VAVHVVETDSQIAITVRDDGHGFDPGAVTSGFGLASMRERVELLGGELSLTSVRGEGTTVTARLPVAGRAEGVDRSAHPSLVPARAPAPASAAAAAAAAQSSSPRSRA
jgi:signal transduction histidine kinase